MLRFSQDRIYYSPSTATAATATITDPAMKRPLAISINTPGICTSATAGARIAPDPAISILPAIFIFLKNPGVGEAILSLASSINFFICTDSGLTIPDSGSPSYRMGNDPGRGSRFVCTTDLFQFRLCTMFHR